ncbi:hypothetical protein AMECASPLE_018104 [Ameca splendens]|uniref:Uncharacterized protein n=1 Tax=Ameca splendens TaxID=208324 RepID=A0ABV0YDR1_9TELE
MRIPDRNWTGEAPNSNYVSLLPGKGGRDAFLHACPGSGSYPTASQPLKEPNVPLSYVGASAQWWWRQVFSIPVIESWST